MAQHEGSSSEAMTAAVVGGGCLLLCAYGVIVLLADFAFGTELVPTSVAGAAGIIAVLVVVGAVLGGAYGKARAR